MINGSLPAFSVMFYLGITETGLFDRVFFLVILPMEYLASGLSRVLFPVFSQFQEQKEVVGLAFKTTITLAASVLLPTAAGMAVAGDQIILTILGPEWAPSIAFLPLITVYAGFMFISHFFGVLIDAYRQLKRKMILQTLVLLLTISAFISVQPATFHHLFYILISAEVLKLLVFFFFSMRLLSYSPMDLVSMICPSIIPVMGVVGGIYTVKVYLNEWGVSAPGSLLLCILAGFIALSISLWGSWVFMYSEEIKGVLSKGRFFQKS